MKTKSLFIVILGFFVLCMAVPAHSWQGRMGGMGDPYGLVTDESDFLIHPAAIANGKGMNFYGDFRYTYNKVSKWNLDLTGNVPSDPGCTACHQSYKNSGHEQKYEGLLGAALPLGPGRMGVFLQYAGKRGKFDGDNFWTDGSGSYLYNLSLKSNLDSFILRLLYGLPMGAFKVGGEIQLAYRNEKNNVNSEYLTELPGYWEYDKNCIWQTIFPNNNNPLFFMFPYDSQYWEALFKGSLEGAIGPAKVAFTMRGGFIFAGDNKLETHYFDPFFEDSTDMSGKVKGWNIGGDLWVRYPLKEGLSLPFLVKVGYQQKARGGSGPLFINGSMSPYSEDYKSVEKSFNVEVGGGVDKEFIKGTRVAAGIYYNYLNNKNRISIEEYELGGGYFEYWDNSKFPDQTENRIILRLSGEKELSPMLAMRVGLSFFYGWVKEDYESSNSSIWAPFTETASMDGYRWGIGASLGGTVKFQQFSLEPFLGGGYQQLKLSGDGSNPTYPGGLVAYDLNKKRNEWFIGGGLSIKFNP